MKNTLKGYTGPALHPFSCILSYRLGESGCLTLFSHHPSAEEQGVLPLNDSLQQSKRKHADRTSNEAEQPRGAVASA
jgi:hypothetical protein